MFGGLEDIIWTNIDILTLHYDLDIERSTPFFFHKTLWLMMMNHQAKFAFRRISTSENIVEGVIFNM